MNKNELRIVVILILLIPVWLMIDSKFIKPRYPAPAPVPTAVPESPEQLVDVEDSEQESDELGAPEPDNALLAEPTQTNIAPALEPAVEETTYVLNTHNDEGENVVSVTFSTIGGGIKEVVLHPFPYKLDDKGDPDGERVRLTFNEHPALVYDSSLLNARSPFSVMTGNNEGEELTLGRELANGIRFTRTVRIRGGYELEVLDQWTNTSSRQLTVPEMSLFLGPMYPQEGISQRFGPYVGIDAEHTDGVGVKHYVKTITKGLKSSDTFEETIDTGLTWFAVKNKFFSQVLTIEEGGLSKPESLTLRAAKGKEARSIGMARPSAQFDSGVLEPGEVLKQTYSYYVGPSSAKNLKALGAGQEGLIDYRLWKVFLPIANVLLWGLNSLYAMVGNWGLAIILLTFIVRMVIWPLSLKGTSQMKRMSALAPQMKELREKHKNDPQKLNQEMAAFYKKHNVNPLAGCLPMLVQFPIFISMYGVLRVAVGFRFSEFLWIDDLSEQEALFYLGTIPVNILPLFAGGTMILLQRLTPSNMDPQQQKIMMMMPIVFLVFTYSMPSGLMLYMSTSNLVSIYQNMHIKKRDAKLEGEGGTVSPSPKKDTQTKSSGKRKGKS